MTLNHDGPLRRLTPRQAQIAHAIGRGLSYAAIAAELRSAKGRALSQLTIAAGVKGMALLFDEEEIDPKQRVFLWVKRLEWDLGHPPSIEDVLQASVASESRRRHRGSTPDANARRRQSESG